MQSRVIRGLRHPSMDHFPQRCLDSFLKGFDDPPTVTRDPALSYREPLYKLEKGETLSDGSITTIVVSIDVIQLFSTDIDSFHASFCIVRKILQRQENVITI